MFISLSVAIISQCICIYNIALYTSNIYNFFQLYLNKAGKIPVYILSTNIWVFPPPNKHRMFLYYKLIANAFG